MTKIILRHSDHQLPLHINIVHLRQIDMNSDQPVYRIGFITALTAFGFTLAYVLIQLWQVYGRISSPLDEVLIYTSSLCIVIPFIMTMLALHYVTPHALKYWSQLAFTFSLLYAVFVTINYVVQLATVVPARLKGTLDKISGLVQTPHSLMWDLDALGYIFMGLAMLVALPALSKDRGQKWARYAFFANAAVTPLIMIVYFYPVYSERLLMLGYPWGMTAPLAMLALAFSFRTQSAALNK